MVCVFGKENRVMIQALKEDIIEIKEGIGRLENKIQELFNHQSNRLPIGITIIITILSSAVVGLSVAFLKGG
jgi:hypothetical protein